MHKQHFNSETVMKTLALLSLLIGCSKTTDDDSSSWTEADGNEENENAGGEDEEADTAEPAEGDDVDPLCAEDYSLCGELIIPSDFTGTTRSLAIVLYSTVPPMGPPDGIVAEIETPELTAGDSFPVRIQPAIFNGDYHVWVNLYMDGGGEWAPVNGVDYVGYTAEPVVFDGTAISFDDISLSIASGW